MTITLVLVFFPTVFKQLRVLLPSIESQGTGSFKYLVIHIPWLWFLKRRRGEFCSLVELRACREGLSNRMMGEGRGRVPVSERLVFCGDQDILLLRESLLFLLQGAPADEPNRLSLGSGG